MVNRNSDAVIENVAFTIVVLAACFGILSILNYAAKELVDVIKSFPDEKAAELFTTDSTGAVGEDFFALQFVSVLAYPGGEFFEIFNVRANGVFKMAEVELVVIAGVENHRFRFLHGGLPLSGGEMVSCGLVW